MLKSAFSPSPLPSLTFGLVTTEQTFYLSIIIYLFPDAYDMKYTE